MKGKVLTVMVRIRNIESRLRVGKKVSANFVGQKLFGRFTAPGTVITDSALHRGEYDPCMNVLIEKLNCV